MQISNEVITSEMTQAELEIQLVKNGVAICQVSFMPDGSRRCDLADHIWARGEGKGPDVASAINAALINLREQLAILAGADPNKPVSLDK